MVGENKQKRFMNLLLDANRRKLLYQKEKKNIIWKSNRNNANYLFMNNWLQMKQRGYNLGNVLRKKKYNNIVT